MRKIASLMFALLLAVCVQTQISATSTIRRM